MHSDRECSCLKGAEIPKRAVKTLQSESANQEEIELSTWGRLMLILLLEYKMD